MLHSAAITGARKLQAYVGFGADIAGKRLPASPLPQPCRMRKGEIDDYSKPLSFCTGCYG